jgi:hypothetical protein
MAVLLLNGRQLVLELVFWSVLPLLRLEWLPLASGDAYEQRTRKRCSR